MTYRALSFALVFAIACGDDDGPVDEGVTDTGAALDMSTDEGADDAALDLGRDEGVDAAMDEGVADASIDTGIDTGVSDTGVADTGIDTGVDTGVDLGTGPCAGQIIGTRCDGSCERGYSCIDGRCMPPSGRPTCGGFAGALCTTRAFPECTWAVPANLGPCLSSEEAACACAEHRDRFQCFTF